MEIAQIATIASKEFWDRIRNRWVLAVALVFTAFALTIDSRCFIDARDADAG